MTFTFPAKYNNKYVYFLFSSDATGTVETTDFIQIVNNTVSLTHTDNYNAIYGCIVDDVNVVTKSGENILVTDDAISASDNVYIYRIDNVYGVTNIPENYIAQMYVPYIYLTPINEPPNADYYTVQISSSYINSYNIVRDEPSGTRTDISISTAGMGETTINAFDVQNPMVLNMTCYDFEGNALVHVPSATYTSDSYEIDFILTTDPIIYTLSHCTGASTNPTEIGDTEVTATFTADALYELPETVTVTGAEYTWNKSAGKLTLSNPTGVGVVSVTISAVAKSANSVDLTTLPGWSSLSSGTHNITIVAKAAGYRDSEPSAAVNVEKAAE